MNNRGFISIEYLFAVFIILIIATGLLFYSNVTIESSSNIESNFNYRLILDNLANEINQVNANGEGYSKNITLPLKDYKYVIEVKKNKLTIEYSNKKGETSLPFNNIENSYKLYAGRSYTIEKTNNGRIVIK